MSKTHTKSIKYLKYQKIIQFIIQPIIKLSLSFLC